MNEYKIYAGGEFVTSSEKISVNNSHTNDTIAFTYLANKEILEKSILKAQECESELKEMPSFKKEKILLDIVHKISSKKEELAIILANEASKPFTLAYGEIERAIQTFKVAAEECKRFPNEYISLDWTPAGNKKEGIVRYFPIGLVAGIAPFNFPLNLAVHKIAPAIAAGCPIILKPATSTPLSTLELAKIIDQTELPKGAISILPMDRKTGNLLVTDNRFKLLSFTGSPEVGWKMKNDAGKKKVVLELGGNAGAIITESSDINLAIKKSVIGAFAYQGQVCIHSQRFIVHKSKFETFKNELINEALKLKKGNPEDRDTQMTSMIDEHNAIRVENWVNEAISEGATLFFGGKRENAYYEPTILGNVKNTSKVYCEEIFGPVVTIESYDTFEEAVNIINNTNFGLQAGVFTNDINEMNYAFNNIEVGGLMLNDIPGFRVDHMPYGGIKDSGIGREGIKYAIHDMLEPRILVKDY